MAKPFLERYDWEVEEALVSLAENPAFQTLVELMEQDMEHWLQRFANGLVTSKNLVDQREVDEKRGFNRGATHYLVDRIEVAKKRIARRAVYDTPTGGDA